MLQKLDSLQIEIPSWGFANTGTRFGKFLQAGAATTLEQKFADASEVHALTGATPRIALHVLWDLPNGMKDVDAVKELEAQYGIRAGSINPNLFQNQEYKLGSICNPDPAVRRMAIDHLAGIGGNCKGFGIAGYFALDCGRVELSRVAEHSCADWRGWKRR